MARQKKEKLNVWLSLLVLVVVCVFLNFLGARINALFGLPFFIDNIGTILSALLGGYIPCITVGFFSNIINGISNPDSVYYSVISVFIAGAAAMFARKIRRINIPYVILSIIVFAFLGGVVGGMLTWLIYGMSFGEGAAVDFASMINNAVPMGYLPSNLLSCFIIDIGDKAIVTVISLLIYKLIPVKLIDYLKDQEWYYINIIEDKNRNIRRRASLRTKSIMLFTVSITLVVAAAIGTSVLQYHDTAMEKFERQGEHAAAIIASHINSERIDIYLQKGERTADYLETKELLQTVSDSSPDIEFIYVYRIEEDGSHVVFDLDTEELAADKPGDIIEYDSTIAKYSDLFLSGKEIPVDITDDEYGWLMSVYEPVRSNFGEVECYVGVDLSMERLRSQEIGFLTKIIALFIAFLILIRTYAIWMAQRHIINPINTIADAANSFIYDTPEARENSIKMIEDLNINTGDEIEYLYDAYKKMYFDTVHYINEFQKKNEQVTRLKNGMVLVLADLVESRDKCTGDHVRKTAAYCDIILRQMQKEGIYKDQLTEEFIAEVVSSAPLHDVGKIRVSDTILNKPGKLTDEEFGIMKSHTIAGGEIIDRVADAVGEKSEYLTEARNLASYHHERWDGTGYPEHLSGEDIPLSSRVMAVADVFDALVSRRSYKEPFTVEKAFDIIREESGTHFDPLVVQAFLDAEDEVRRVKDLHMDSSSS